MFRVWLEWDFGQDGVIFTSDQKARDWVEEQISNNESLSVDYRYKGAVFDAGMASISEVTVI